MLQRLVRSKKKFSFLIKNLYLHYPPLLFELQHQSEKFNATKATKAVKSNPPHTSLPQKEQIAQFLFLLPCSPFFSYKEVLKTLWLNLVAKQKTSGARSIPEVVLIILIPLRPNC